MMIQGVLVEKKQYTENLKGIPNRIPNLFDFAFNFFIHRLIKGSHSFG